MKNSLHEILEIIFFGISDFCKVLLKYFLIALQYAFIKFPKFLIFPFRHFYAHAKIKREYSLRNEAIDGYDSNFEKDVAKELGAKDNLNYFEASRYIINHYSLLPAAWILVLYFIGILIS